LAATAHYEAPPSWWHATQDPGEADFYAFRVWFLQNNVDAMGILLASTSVSDRSVLVFRYGDEEASLPGVNVHLDSATKFGHGFASFPLNHCDFNPT